MSKHIKNISILLATGSPVAIAAAQHIAYVQSMIHKIPVEQIMEMARALLGG